MSSTLRFLCADGCSGTICDGYKWKWSAGFCKRCLKEFELEQFGYLKAPTSLGLLICKAIVLDIWQNNVDFTSTLCSSAVSVDPSVYLAIQLHIRLWPHATKERKNEKWGQGKVSQEWLLAPSSLSLSNAMVTADEAKHKTPVSSLYTVPNLTRPECVN